MSSRKETNHGRFAKGTSGNPSGRPQGSRNKIALLIESLLEAEAEPLTRTLVERAKAGDTRALGFCMDRLMPARRDPVVVFDFPAIRRLEDIPLGMMRIMTAVSEGKLTPQEGATMSEILARHTDALNAVDVQRRVEKLEDGPPHDDHQVEIVTEYR